MLSKGRKWASISVGALFWREEHGWAFLSWGLLIRGIFVRFFFSLEICKMPRRRLSLSLRAPLGNLEGVRLLGLLREKK